MAVRASNAATSRSRPAQRSILSNLFAIPLHVSTNKNLNLKHMSLTHSAPIALRPGPQHPELDPLSAYAPEEIPENGTMSNCPTPPRPSDPTVPPIQEGDTVLPELGLEVPIAPSPDPSSTDAPPPMPTPARLSSPLLPATSLTSSPDTTTTAPSQVIPIPVRPPSSRLTQTVASSRPVSPKHLEDARRPTSPYPRRILRTWRRRPTPSASQTSHVKKQKRAAKTVEKWKGYSHDVKRRITASRVHNPEIGGAGNLMEYLIAIIGPVTRTENLPMWRSIVVCALITAGSVAMAMLYEHPMAQSVAGWMMGLAWDSLWHAIISPQQAEDNARRAWMAEITELLGELEVELELEIPSELSTSEYAMYGDMLLNYNTTTPWYPWTYRVDFVKPDAAWGTTFEGSAPLLPASAIHENHNVVAVSWDTSTGREFRLINFTWRESDRYSASPLLVTTHTVTRTQIQAALERMVRRPNNAWWALDTLRPLLLSTPTKLRHGLWMDAARTAAKIASIFRTQYRDVMRFAVAVHELADYEHAHELPFEDGLWLTHAFDDHFIRPPKFYSPPSLAPSSPTWVFQATEYIHAYFDNEGGEYEHIQGMAMVLAVGEHRKALEKLNGGKKVIKTE
ncbi:hypothetical protein CspHIS471_0312750 [Cutaneotrichosporon sp. HIS471]|nr:hypothetical protein CspHIS471_0312750 [Cutaneotrichosporon sp. HIS471]